MNKDEQIAFLNINNVAAALISAEIAKSASLPTVASTMKRFDFYHDHLFLKFKTRNNKHVAINHIPTNGEQAF